MTPPLTRLQGSEGQRQLSFLAHRHTHVPRDTNTRITHRGAVREKAYRMTISPRPRRYPEKENTRKKGNGAVPSLDKRVAVPKSVSCIRRGAPKMKVAREKGRRGREKKTGERERERMVRGVENSRLFTGKQEFVTVTKTENENEKKGGKEKVRKERRRQLRTVSAVAPGGDSAYGFGSRSLRDRSQRTPRERLIRTKLTLKQKGRTPRNK